MENKFKNWGKLVSNAFEEHLKLEGKSLDAFGSQELNRTYAIISRGLESYNKIKKFGSPELKSFYCPKKLKIWLESDLERLTGGNNGTRVDREYLNSTQKN